MKRKENDHLPNLYEDMFQPLIFQGVFKIPNPSKNQSCLLLATGFLAPIGHPNSTSRGLGGETSTYVVFIFIPDLRANDPSWRFFQMGWKPPTSQKWMVSVGWFSFFLEVEVRLGGVTNTMGSMGLVYLPTWTPEKCRYIIPIPYTYTKWLPPTNSYRLP